MLSRYVIGKDDECEWHSTSYRFPKSEFEREGLQRMKEQRCCGNCHWFDNEDVYGVGWCSNNEHESSCDQVCDEQEF